MNLELSLIENEMESISNQFNIPPPAHQDFQSVQQLLCTPPPLRLPDHARRHDPVLLSQGGPSNFMNNNQLLLSSNLSENSSQNHRSYQSSQGLQMYSMQQVPQEPVSIQSFRDEGTVTISQINGGGTLDNRSMFIPSQQFPAQVPQTLSSSSIFLMPEMEKGIKERGLYYHSGSGEGNYTRVRPVIVDHQGSQLEAPKTTNCKGYLVFEIIVAITNAIRALQERVKALEDENLILKGGQRTDEVELKRHIKILCSQIG